MSVSAPIEILFASEAAANYPLAGIPAAARAIMDAAAADKTVSVTVSVPGGWTPSEFCQSEIERLAPAVKWSAEAEDVQPTERAKRVRIDIAELKIQGRDIIAGTGKPGDGIVSRTINRPVSKAITILLLKWTAVRPWHVTLAVAVIASLMLAALIFGGGWGLIAGAVLFQLASIVDGVDGEVARATFRTSERGAIMDSLTDMATNLSFIGGVSYNLYAGGAQQAGLAGALGFAILTLGVCILALQSRRDGGQFNFDAMKTRFRARPSRLKQLLIYVTMRDFYALAACLAILVGLASELLFVFAIVLTIWFGVLCWALWTVKRPE